VLLSLQLLYEYGLVINWVKMDLLAPTSLLPVVGYFTGGVDFADKVLVLTKESQLTNC
jgi:hypothetical protein